MSRPKPKRWSIRFELAPEKDDDVELYEFINKLAESDEASDWIRKTLKAGMRQQPAQPRSTPPTVPARPFTPVPKPGVKR